MGKFHMARKAVDAARNASDEQIDRAAETITDKTPDSVDSKVDKGADWAKDHNED